MNTGSVILDSAYSAVFSTLPVILAIMIFFCLFKAVKGPKIADRIVAINMIGTLVMVIIAMLAVKMNEGYLVDICIIYAMISFLAVTLITKVYMGVYLENKAKLSKSKELIKENTVEQALNKASNASKKPSEHKNGSSGHSHRKTGRRRRS